jgi:hypothetical protein
VGDLNATKTSEAKEEVEVSKTNAKPSTKAKAKETK